mmetsp:Transcript_32170/g.80892  ORF Transcript_32170/g.80892 Transcript_32170/m.80892 type:complete len:465 (+) Transcript_32170:365-1759(+)
MTYSLKYTKTVIPRLPQSSRKVKTFRIQRHGRFLRSANCIIVMLLVPTSGSRQAGKSSRELVSSKYHLPVAPVHIFTNFASANQRSPSKLIVHRTVCSCSPPRSECDVGCRRRGLLSRHRCDAATVLRALRLRRRRWPGRCRRGDKTTAATSRPSRADTSRGEYWKLGPVKHPRSYAHTLEIIPISCRRKRVIFSSWWNNTSRSMDGSRPETPTEHCVSRRAHAAVASPDVAVAFVAAVVVDAEPAAATCRLCQAVAAAAAAVAATIAIGRVFIVSDVDSPETRVMPGWGRGRRVAATARLFIPERFHALSVTQRGGFIIERGGCKAIIRTDPRFGVESSDVVVTIVQRFRIFNQRPPPLVVSLPCTAPALERHCVWLTRVSQAHVIISPASVDSSLYRWACVSKGCHSYEGGRTSESTWTLFDKRSHVCVTCLCPPLHDEPSPGLLYWVYDRVDLPRGHLIPT